MLVVILFQILAFPIVGTACSGLVVDYTTLHACNLAVFFGVCVLGAVARHGMAHTESAVNHLPPPFSLSVSSGE